MATTKVAHTAYNDSVYVGTLDFSTDDVTYRRVLPTSESTVVATFTTDCYVKDRDNRSLGRMRIVGNGNWAFDPVTGLDTIDTGERNVYRAEANLFTTLLRQGLIG